MASLAAQMEMFGLSKRELEAKFVKSELILLAWRSQEMSFNLTRESDAMRKNMKAGAKGNRRNIASDVTVPENLPEHFFNKDGEIDLRQVTGEEAYRYFSSQGIKLPIMMR